MTVTTAPRPTDARPALSQRRPRRADEVIAPIASWLTMHSVTALRISLGLIIFGFGMLKYFPGASPAVTCGLSGGGREEGSRGTPRHQFAPRSALGADRRCARVMRSAETSVYPASWLGQQ
jgi:hypothetical protein